LRLTRIERNAASFRGESSDTAREIERGAEADHRRV
jgi:hypothetical protein